MVLITSTLRTEDHRGSSIFLDKSGRFQHLQLEFSPQKSDFCAFQNLKLEFFYRKNPSCIFRFKPDGFLVRVTVKGQEQAQNIPEHPQDTPEYPGTPPDGRIPRNTLNYKNRQKNYKTKKPLKIHRCIRKYLSSVSSWKIKKGG